MLHQMPDRGRDTVAAATVNTALSHMDRKFNTEIEKTVYAIRKVHPCIETFEQDSVFLK